MRVGVLGTGDVGKALGNGFLALGHEVMMGSRSATNEKGVAWAATAGARASVGSFADAAAFGEVVVLSTLGAVNESVLGAIDLKSVAGKLFIDTTNPLDPSAGMPPRLSLSGNDSGGEQVQRLLPEARVVKAFNTVGNRLMFKPKLEGGPPDMFICGNDEAAKTQMKGILTDFGWGTVDVGGITSSRYLEGMCLVWVIHGVKTGTWGHAFKLIH